MAPINDTVIPNLTEAQLARFWPKVEQGPGCWEWRGAIHPNGYGTWTVHLGGGRTTSVRPYRVAWHFLRGPIPPGLTIDHLCRNPKCVNPDHLEPVPQAVNNARVPKKPRRQRSASIRERTGPRVTSYSVLFRQGDMQRSVTFPTLAEAEALVAEIHVHGPESVLTSAA